MKHQPITNILNGDKVLAALNELAAMLSTDVRSPVSVKVFSKFFTELDVMGAIIACFDQEQTILPLMSYTPDSATKYLPGKVCFPSTGLTQQVNCVDDIKTFFTQHVDADAVVDAMNMYMEQNSQTVSLIASINKSFTNVDAVGLVTETRDAGDPLEGYTWTTSLSFSAPELSGTDEVLESIMQELVMFVLKLTNTNKLPLKGRTNAPISLVNTTHVVSLSDDTGARLPIISYTPKVSTASLPGTLHVPACNVGVYVKTMEDVQTFCDETLHNACNRGIVESVVATFGEKKAAAAASKYRRLS